MSIRPCIHRLTPGLIPEPLQTALEQRLLLPCLLDITDRSHLHFLLIAVVAHEFASATVHTGGASIKYWRDGTGPLLAVKHSLSSPSYLFFTYNSLSLLTIGECSRAAKSHLLSLSIL
jgi:hypothetical protein